MLEIMLQANSLRSGPLNKASTLYASGTVVGSFFSQIAGNNKDAFVISGYEGNGVTPRNWIFENTGNGYVEVDKITLLNNQYATNVFMKDSTVYIKNNNTKQVDVYTKDIGGTGKYLKTQSIINNDASQYSNVGESKIYAYGDWFFGNVNFDGSHVLCYKLENGIYVKKQVITKPGNDYFGQNGIIFDGEQLIITATSDSSLTTYNGAVYVYKLVGDQFVQHQYIRPENPTYMHRFGRTILLYDAETLITNAINGSGSGPNYIYLYKKIDGNFVKVFEKQVSYNNSFGITILPYKKDVVFNYYTDSLGSLRFFSGIANNALVEDLTKKITGEATSQFFGQGITGTPTELIAFQRDAVNRPAILVYK